MAVAAKAARPTTRRAMGGSAVAVVVCALVCSVSSLVIIAMSWRDVLDKGYLPPRDVLAIMWQCVCCIACAVV